MAAKRKGKSGDKGAKKFSKEAAAGGSKAKGAKKGAKKAVRQSSSSKTERAAKGRKTRARKGAGAKTGKSTGRAAKTTGKETSVTKKSKRTFDKIRENLLERREQLLLNLGKLTGAGEDAATRPVGDRADDAVNDLQVDSSYAIAEQEIEELKLIDEALENIEDGTYGICEECGEPISKPRLRALPYAVLCLKCKQAEEMERAAGGY